MADGERYSRTEGELYIIICFCFAGGGEVKEEIGMEHRIKLGPFRSMDSRGARSICIITFVGFILTLILGGYIENITPGMGAWSLMAGGFFLGVSEVMYWLSKALRSESNFT